MDARQERGLQIAALAPINKGEFGFVVPSQTTNGKAYIVAGEATKVCTCPKAPAKPGVLGQSSWRGRETGGWSKGLWGADATGAGQRL